MKVAFVYDRVNKWGGAERVLLALHELFPNAPLYTSVYNEKTAVWANNFHVISSFLQHIPYAKTHHEWYGLLMPLAFESFTFDTYDLVISVTSEAAGGVITKPETKHICICLTPTRYLWSGYRNYFGNIFFRLVTFPFVRYLRYWSVIASSRPDAFIAISQEVQQRIKRYYKKPAHLIYPPLTLQGNTIKKEEKKLRNNSYFLVVSRLVPYKRVDIAVEVCTKNNYPLIVIGSGTQKKQLETVAGKNVIFLEALTDEEIIEYYTNCCALLFPGEEDFGLTVLEAQSCGKPVVAFKGAGALETVIEGKTGEFFFPQTSSALEDKLRRLLQVNKITFDEKKESIYKKACLQQAQKFNKITFQKELQKVIETLI